MPPARQCWTSPETGEWPRTWPSCRSATAPASTRCCASTGGHGTATAGYAYAQPGPLFAGCCGSPIRARRCAATPAQRTRSPTSRTTQCGPPQQAESALGQQPVCPNRPDGLASRMSKYFSSFAAWQPGHPHFGTDALPRLVLKPTITGADLFDGASWPRSNDLATKLPDLITTLIFHRVESAGSPATQSPGETYRARSR